MPPVTDPEPSVPATGPERSSTPKLPEVVEEDANAPPPPPSAKTRPKTIYESKPQNSILWSSFGPHTWYGERNDIIVGLLSDLQPPVQRVFEFAGNGGFLAQSAILNSKLRQSLKFWLHSEFSGPVLDYATYLFSNETLLMNPQLSVDVSKPEKWHKSVPMAVTVKGVDHSPEMKLEVRDIDMTQLDKLTELAGAPLSSFDTFTTISFEHFGEDLELIRAFPPGSFFVFGVAGFLPRSPGFAFLDHHLLTERAPSALVHIGNDGASYQP